MKRFLTCIIAVLAFLSAYSQVKADSMKVYFRVSSSKFDPSLGDNRSVMDNFIREARQYRSEIDSIVIRGYASPEGGSQANERLATRRCQSVADYIVANANISRSLILAQPQGEAWAELRSLVAATPDVPYRKSILNILDNTPVWIFDSEGNIVSGRKKKLMNLHGGRPYRWMLTNLFPQLRNAVAVTLYYKHSQDETPANMEAELPPVITQKPQPEQQPATPGLPAATIMPSETDNTEASPLASELPADPCYRFAIKTNILYYAALMPNIEVQWNFAPRWSACLEGNVAWWKRASKEQTYNIAVISPEVRRWFSPKSGCSWQGWYAGAFAGGGWYDLGLHPHRKGYYGHGGMAGISLGYMWSIGRRLSLEAGVGAGYMYTRYKEYIPLDGHHVYQRTKSLSYVGPLKLKLSIAWRFYDSNKRNSLTPVK